MEENISVAIVYRFLAQQKYWNVVFKIALRLMVSKGLRYLKTFIC